MNNLFQSIPEDLSQEVIEDLLQAPSVRIERIISRGQASPEDQWYDQAQNEWVLVVQGKGRIQYDDGREVTLSEGDFVHIPAHCRHRVSWTAPDQLTIWLAIFY